MYIACTLEVKIHYLMCLSLTAIPPCRQSAGDSTLYMQHLMGGYLKEYGRLIDGPTEESKGLNNFTAAAKVLSTGHRRGTIVICPVAREM